MNANLAATRLNSIINEPYGHNYPANCGENADRRDKNEFLYCKRHHYIRLLSEILAANDLLFVTPNMILTSLP